MYGKLVYMNSKPSKQEIVKIPGIAPLLAEYAEIRKEIMSLSNAAVLNLEVAVAYAVDDMINELRGLGGDSHLAYLADTIDYDRGKLNKLKGSK